MTDNHSSYKRLNNLKDLKMSTHEITIKRQYHRAHPCSKDKKTELLQLLIERNEKSTVLVVTSKDEQELKNAIISENVTVVSDSELPESSETKYDVLISYDVPDSADIYMKRLTFAKIQALLLLSKDEQQKLYPIETVLKRTLLQEIITGFDQEVVVAPEKKVRRRDEDKRDSKAYEKKPRDEKRVTRKPDRDDKHRRSDSSSSKGADKSDRWAKKDKKPSKYLGRDENGKAIFSGKTGDRNHRYDGTPKPKREPRKINVKKTEPKKEGE